MALSPINFTPSQFWEGNDGSWSSFAIRVGTPAQVFRVFPSTAGQETWVPLPEACMEIDLSNCAQSRGAIGKLFQTNESLTWKEIGIYDLSLESELGYNGNGLFGLDNIGLQVPNSGGVDLEGQVVAGIITNDFYLGVFGLGPKPVNFTNLNYPVPSVLQSFKEQGKIPSLSWGYTAGAFYRVPKAYGSLTLGGYDNLRFNQSNNEYPFDTDDSKPLSIFVESISASNSLQGRTTLLDGTNTVYAAIDSTIPHLWLPREVCDRFEQAFGLLYDPATELYIAGDKNARDKIRNMNASITLGLGLNTGPAKRTNIVLPYAAFDLEASYPIYPNSTHYFPLRRAENNTQYRLGRTFLQEAYVIADYERSKFSIHQARFGNTMPAQSIVAIPPVQTSVNEKNESSIKPPENQERNQGSSLSRGAIIGVVFGVFIAIIISLSIFFRQKKKKKLSTQPIGAGNEPLPQELHWNVSKPPELEENMLCEMWQIPQELDSGVEVGVRRGDGSDTTV